MQALSLTCRRRYNRHVVGLRLGLAPATNGHILAMRAVGPTPDPVSAIQQGGLRALAAHVIQQNQADALAKGPIQDDLGLTPEDREDTAEIQPQEFGSNESAQLLKTGLILVIKTGSFVQCSIYISISI